MSRFIKAVISKVKKNKDLDSMYWKTTNNILSKCNSNIKF